MKLLTEDAIVVCTHQLGNVKLKRKQDLVTVAGRRVLVDDDPEQCSVSMCPNYGVTVKPCSTTLAVSAGHSSLLSVANVPVCLDSLRGLTDGMPPSVVEYEVRWAGQALVGSMR